MAGVDKCIQLVQEKQRFFDDFKPQSVRAPVTIHRRTGALMHLNQKLLNGAVSKILTFLSVCPFLLEETGQEIF